MNCSKPLNLALQQPRDFGGTSARFTTGMPGLQDGYWAHSMPYLEAHKEPIKFIMDFIMRQLSNQLSGLHGSGVIAGMAMAIKFYSLWTGETLPDTQQIIP